MMLWLSRLAIGLILALSSAVGARAGGDPMMALQAAISAETEKNGATSPYLLPLYEQLAHLQFLAGHFDAAASAQRHNLTIAIAAFGPESPNSAQAMTALAEAKLDQLKYIDAEGLLIAADAVLAAEPGGDDQARVPVWTGLARVALARGDLAVARTRAEQAVALRATNPYPRSSAALRALGAALAAERRYDEAEPPLQQAIAFDRGKHDPENLETARSLSQLGNLYLRAQRFADALPLLEDAAAIDQSRLAPNHPFIADDLHDLGIAYDGMKRPTEARQVLNQAIALLQKGSEKNGPRVAYCEQELARIDRIAGNGDAADAETREGRRLLDAAQGDERIRDRSI